jgi:endonuclease/exonuclease/phosphatase (EEP) superfamily protein YafD
MASETGSKARRDRLRRLLKLLSIACAVGYPIALVTTILALRFVGEQWWVAAAALYLPRVGFALPLPFILLLLWWVGAPRRYSVLQSVSVWLLLFPLMGFSLGSVRRLGPTPGPVIRVMTFNVSFGAPGAPAVLAQARESEADIVLLQDTGAGMVAALEQALEGWQFNHTGEFLLATRFPIRATYVPPALEYPQGTGGAHYVQYTLETPLGLVDVFNVHLTSPRAGLEEVRGNGLREEVTSGRLLAGKASGAVEWNAFRRRRQVAGIAERASAIRNAVIVAGDTNLPGLSWILGENLGHYRDAFNQAGLGFGYTFPAKRPWMRIDRILTNSRLMAIAARVGQPTLSDHRAVFAVLAPQRD